MKYLKRLTDFCGGFAAFAAIIYFLGQFIMFRPSSDDAGLFEKLKIFLGPQNGRNFGAYVFLVLLLIVSIVLGRIFDEFPTVCMCVSLLPFLQTLFMLTSGWLYRRPMLYVVLVTVHFGGNFIYALSLDRADRKRRAYFGVNAVTAVMALIAFIAHLHAKKFDEAEVITLDELDAMSDFDSALVDGLEVGDTVMILLVLAIMFAVTAIISLLLRDLYYIDAILSGVAAVYSLRVFRTETLTAFAGVIFLVCAILFIFRMAVLFSEPMRGDADSAEGKGVSGSRTSDPVK